MSKDNYKVKTNKEIRAYAREQLLGNMLIPVVVTLFYMFASMGFNNIASLGLMGEDVFSLIFYIVLTIVLQTIRGIFIYGVSHYYLSFVTNKKARISSLFEGFKHSTDRIMGISFLLAIIAAVVNLPYYIYTFLFFQSSLKGFLIMISLWILGLLLNFLISIYFAPIYYIMCDIEDITLPLAIVMSFSMMTSSKYFKYLRLKLSFIPLYLVSMLSFGFGLVWLTPYINTSEAYFYEDLCDEYESVNRKED